MSCRVCGAEGSLLLDRGDLRLYRCRACRFVWGQPSRSETPAAQYAGYYRRELPAAPTGRYAEWLERAEARLGRGRLLEVGAGAGAFTSVALQRGWRVDATEVSGSGLEILRTTGATVFEGDVEGAQYPEAAFDLVVSLEVLEHLPDPLRHIKELSRVTRPAGMLLLTTPNYAGLSRRLFGARWRVITPEHLGYFTGSTLEALLRRVGYASTRIRSRSLDVSTWRSSVRDSTPRFDPHGSARLRDAVEGRPALRIAKEAINGLLGLSGLGDSLLAWARK